MSDVDALASFFGGDSGGEDVPVVESEVDANQVTDPVEPEDVDTIAPVTEEPEPTPEPEARVEVAATPQVSEPVVPAQQAEPEQLTDEQVRSQVAQLRDALAAQYTLSDDDADLLLTDPQKVLPKLLANMQMQSLQMMQQINAQALPDRIQAIQAQQMAQQSLETKFVSRWPGLKNVPIAQLKTAVQVAAQTRAEGATQDELIEKVGQLVYTIRGEQAPAQAAARVVAKPKPHTQVRGSSPMEKPKPANEQEAFFSGLG